MSDGPKVHDPERAWDGYTLVAYIHKEPDDQVPIYLVDMNGSVVHRWKVDTALQSYCKLLPDGNLLYPTRDRTDIGEAGVRELDPAGNEQWWYHCRTDHDMQLVGVHDPPSPRIPDGHLLVHTLNDEMTPAIGEGLVRNPYIVEIDPEQRLQWEWRGEAHFHRLGELLSDAEWAFVRDRIETRYGFDWAHNNTLQMIPENDAYEQATGDAARRVEPGNIVFSYRSVDVIGTIDYPSGEIVWAWGPNELDGQHHPHVLANGNVLCFDNGTEREWSRVIEIDPLAEEIVWQYPEEPDASFYSPAVSGAQRLPNGNTLVCSGNQRWLFEVTLDGEIVWEFEDPYREENEASDMIYRCQRYSKAYCEPLLDRS